MMNELRPTAKLFLTNSEFLNSNFICYFLRAKILMAVLHWLLQCSAFSCDFPNFYYYSSKSSFAHFSVFFKKFDLNLDQNIEILWETVRRTQINH